MRHMYLEDIADAPAMVDWKFADGGAARTVRVLSIDAWRDHDGWMWNNWFHVGEFPVTLIDATPRKILAWLRDQGYLSVLSTGQVAIDDDGYNLVICERGNHMPLYAIEYGDLNV